MFEPLVKAAEAAATRRRDAIEQRLRNELPPDVTIDREGDEIILSGRRLAIRRFTDDRFAFLRDLS